jgi:hypothetical protein
VKAKTIKTISHKFFITPPCKNGDPLSAKRMNRRKVTGAG